MDSSLQLGKSQHLEFRQEVHRSQETSNQPAPQRFSQAQTYTKPMGLEAAQLDLTIAICTYNGANRIPEVLDCLCRQENIQHLNWQVMVVDNNSSDQTAAVVKHYQAQWPFAMPLRYVFERRQGAGYARHRAMQVAESSWVGFLDDDNLPAPNWVGAAYDFAKSYPSVGVYGSRIEGDFEHEPPKDFERIAPFLALTDRGDQPLLYHPHAKILPPGAGMVVKRDLWLKYVPVNPVLGGRTQSSMLTGEDLEAVLHIQRAGWEIWYNPEMQLQHKIPQQRLEHQYLVKLMRGIGLSRQRTRMLSVSPWQRPIIFWAYQLNDLLKMVKHVIRHNLAAWQEPVAASEMTLYWFSFLSPYYLWYRQLRNWVLRNQERRGNAQSTHPPA
ncbi:MAG: hormogonium polysaccharide biosynthesis glycosyltransferase HpsE [Leptolyngbyaceae cyanobacterium]